MAVGRTGSKHPVKIFANIFISFIGAGVLGLPFAFKEAGILEGIFVMATIGIISVKAMLLLIDCKYKLISEYRLPRNEKAKVETSPKKVQETDAKEDGLLSLQVAKQEFVNLITEEEVNKEEDPGHDLSYGDVGFYAIGYHGRLLVDLAIVISQTGFCCAYLIFITENLSDYMRSMKLIHWLLILLPPICFMTLLRHLGSLAMTSFDTKTATVLNSLLEVVRDLQHRFEKFEKQIEKIDVIQCTVNTLAHRVDDIEKNLEYVMNRSTEMEGSVANMGHLMHKVVDRCKENISDITSLKTAELQHKDDVIELKWRSMKTNLIFSGIQFHSDENTEETLNSFIKQKLNIDKKSTLLQFTDSGKEVAEGAGMILSLESSLAKEVRKQFKTYFIFTMFIVTFLYISFGSAGYLSFGPQTDEIITLNLPKGDSLDFAVIVKSLLCLALFFTYPVMMFPVMKILEGYLMSNPEKHIWRGNALRVIMVLITGMVVMVIPNFATLMALVGATCCTMLAFVLPGLFHMTIFKGSLTIYEVIIDWTLMFIGIVGAIIGTIDAFKRLSNAPSDEVVLPANLTETVGHIVSNIMSNITTVKSASP
ncbi:PAT [Mytilus edulis]|uniref:SLC36A n=2 Tax=Mytilus TaxID=6548 RepID=A0A8S3T820_MYTED|nr:PAT [Mytilus edulis]